MVPIRDASTTRDRGTPSSLVPSSLTWTAPAPGSGVELSWDRSVDMVAPHAMQRQWCAGSGPVRNATRRLYARAPPCGHQVHMVRRSCLQEERSWES
ncbi:hypothetical protein ACFFX0_27315 [Citricoccus parietis]|uniref:Uncharacterized protein n=1 Tax=Citricoccus parietis TaxID=592307 RepID=A0ABV5G8E7_9MICC